MRRLLPVLALVLAGCSPRQPDASLVLWEQPAPQVAAQAHAREKGLIASSVAGVSMEPLIVAGDWYVADAAFPFAKLRDGDVIIYAPDWTTGLVIHACAAKSGDAWIMHGVNNAHYENAANGGLHVYARHYRGKVVQIYTKRAKP
jgi:hypothetical protein